MKVAVINGPNLNLLGTRQPEIYGDLSLDGLEAQIREWADSMGIEPIFHQSNDESELVQLIQDAADTGGILLNPGGFTHTSVAIADAVASIAAPVVEVHLSNIENREAFRHVSLVAPNAVCRIFGRGAIGYRDALRHLVNRARMPFEVIRYGPHARNVADLRRASGSPALVVVVHGGYWFPGWDRDQMDSVAIDLTDRGFDTLNIEYRVAPPWPGSGHDVAMAVAHARGLHERIALLGHSAGGYLALWVHDRSPVDLCMGLAPVTDLSILGEDVPAAGAIIAAGGKAAMDFSPDTVLFHGVADDWVTLDHSRRGVERARVEFLEGVGHFDILSPDRPHWEKVVSTLSDRFTI